MLTVIDEYTREALSMIVANTMGSSEVLKALYPLLLKGDKPELLRLANGPEFSSESLKDWLTKVGTKPIRIYPGTPWENGYNERFNGTLRREVLYAEWFGTTLQTQNVINQWLRQYNQIRSHQALHMHPLVLETILESHQISGTAKDGWSQSNKT
jgi:putative transposase